MHESIIGRLHSNGSVLRESGSELAREWFSFADKVALLNRNIHLLFRSFDSFSFFIFANLIVRYRENLSKAIDTYL